DDLGWHVRIDGDTFGRRQDPVEPPGAVLLVHAEGRMNRRERVGERLCREPERREEALDSFRARGWNPLELEGDAHRGAEAVCNCLAVEQLAEPAGGLERVAQRVAQVESGPTGGIALVAEDDLDLRPRRSFDDFRDGTGVERL